MAIWVYSDFEDDAVCATYSLKAARLRKHISEVSAVMAASVAGDGKSRETSSLRQYIADLRARLIQFEGMPGVGGGPSTGGIRFGRAQ